MFHVRTFYQDVLFFFNFSLNAVKEKGSYQKKKCMSTARALSIQKTATQFELSAKIKPGELDGHLLISYLTIIP